MYWSLHNTPCKLPLPLTIEVIVGSNMAVAAQNGSNSKKCHLHGTLWHLLYLTAPQPTFTMLLLPSHISPCISSSNPQWLYAVISCVQWNFWRHIISHMVLWETCGDHQPVRPFLLSPAVTWSPLSTCRNVVTSCSNVNITWVMSQINPHLSHQSPWSRGG